MSDDNTLHFSFTFLLDRDEFFRRTCPNCGRDFKTKVDPADLTSMLQPTFRRIEDEVGEISLSTSEGEQSPQYLSCPYCNHRAETGEMLTSEFQEYMKRFITREYVLPQINNLFSEFSDSMKRTSRSTGSFGIKISFDYDSTLPPRPISGPEAPDMMRIDMLCCGNSIKVRDGYFAINKCPYCDEDVMLT
ncbi:MAG TPA: hypothetical protein PLN86_17130 [Candidatus Hydrogenedentes bacterium]|nr:hypothetical protein [Candidatus Hydrogenedentota bacterium]